ncbi:hypothetical protein EDEG_01644 [Edhazardia aedis USNM 41457]|uniref:Uncharacterized protein n=1 Tax=Edhazardia aedis (strain USNM 41457) TaxID=1003232 RepID=J8ZWP1_EDHAE|nr:hypothetical protein EDEG_01644 [Edhazardia aedis USNM 41457]|eukprot:EJW04068.1 hypothetical protein EDEG_01644 [Edhazardia aedis USNM 41457]
MTQNYYFLMFITNRYKGVQARDEVTNRNQLSSDNSRRVNNIVEYFLQYNQVPSCNSNMLSRYFIRNYHRFIALVRIGNTLSSECFANFDMFKNSRPGCKRNRFVVSEITYSQISCRGFPLW